MENVDDDLSYIAQRLPELHASEDLPYVRLSPDEELFRVQLAEHPDAEHFGVPTQEMGRYNDPDCRHGVWYGAQDPAAALGETFCRTRASGPLRHRRDYISSDDLRNRNMTKVRITRSVVLLDIAKALPKFKLSSDLITGPDYAMTQQVVRTLLALPRRPYDGVAYHSRHYQNGNYCIALWERDGSEKPIKTTSMRLLSDFSIRRKAPDDRMTEMDAEEILTDILGIHVM